MKKLVIKMILIPNKR